MAWRNLAFLYFNPWFGVFMGAVGAFAAWLLHFGTRVLDDDLASYLGAGSITKGLCNLFWLMLETPWPWLIVVAIFFALRYFVDFEDAVRKALIGAAHTAAQVLVFLAAVFVAARFLPDDFWIVIASGVAASITAPTIMGLYLLIMLNIFRVHWDEAFAALRIADHKGFLRLRITAAGDLEVYPIVLDQVPDDDRATLSPRLFDGPIRIRKNDFGVPLDSEADTTRV